MSEWWRWSGWPTADEWQAVWGLVTVIVAVVAAVVALRHYNSSVSSELEQARPFVVVDFLFKGAVYACIEVSNVGRTGARDIKFEWSDRPIAENDRAQGVIDRSLVDGGIPFLAPGRSIVYMLNVFDGDESESLPRRFEVNATYSGSGDAALWTSESVLDIDQWAETSVPEDPYASIAGPLRDLVNSTKHQAERDRYIVKAADSINLHLEAGHRVQTARHQQRIEREQRVAQIRQMESDRRARRAEHEEASVVSAAPSEDSSS